MRVRHRMGSFVPLVVIVLVVVVGGFWAIAKLGKQQQRQQQAILADSDALRYQPPAGQDPAVLVAALGRAGYVTSIDETTGGTPTLLVSSDTDTAPDREHVRRLIADTDQMNFEGDAANVAPSPRFLDE
jgi:hypothetical protein